MSDTKIGFDFGANTAGFNSGVSEVKAQIGGIQGAVGGLVDAFLVLGGAATGSFREMRTGAQEAGEKIKGTAEAVTELREAVSGIGEALIAAFAVEQISEFAKKMGENAEASYKAALVTGFTTGEIQRQKGVAASLGIEYGTLETAQLRTFKAMAQAREGATQQSDAFKRLGIDIKGSYTAGELWNRTLAGFAGMEAGPAKAAVAWTLLGRNIKEMGPLLGLTKDQLAEINTTLDDYGVQNDVAEQKGLALADAFHVNAVASQGLKNVLADALAPAFTSVVEGVNEMILGFIRSYQAGGAAKTVMDALAWTVKAAADVIGLFGVLALDVFKSIDAAAWAFESVLDPLGDLVAGVCRTMADSFRLFGRVAVDVLTMNWGAIAGDLKAGAERVAGDIANTARNMGRTAAQNFKRGADEWASTNSDVDKYEKWSKALWGPGGKLPELPKPGKGTTGDDTLKPPKGAKGGADAGGESDMQALQEKFDQEENSHNDMIRNMKADELAYWSSVKTNVQGGALSERDAAAVRMKVAALTHEVAMQAINDEIAKRRDGDAKAIGDIQDAAARQRASIADQIKDVEEAERKKLISHQEAQAQILKLIGEEKKAATDAANAILGIKTATDTFIETKTEEGTSQFKQAEKDKVDAAVAADRQIVAANDAAQKEMEDRNRRAADEAAANAHSWVDPVVGAWSSGIDRMITKNGSFMDIVKGTWQSLLSTIINKIAQWVEDWVVKHVFMTSFQRAQTAIQVATHSAGEATKTAATVMGTTTRAAAETHGSLIIRVLEALGLAHHTGAEAAKTGATLAGVATRTTAEAAGAQQSLAITLMTALKQIAAHAAAAAAAAYHALAGIPIIGPALGAAAAVVTFAAVMAYQGLASAAGGWGDVPEDQLAMVHKNEMILPAGIASYVRSAAVTGAGSTAGATLRATEAGRATEGGSSGHVFNFSPSHSHNQADLGDLLEKQGATALRWFQNQVRNNAIKVRR